MKNNKKLIIILVVLLIILSLGAGTLVMLKKNNKQVKNNSEEKSNNETVDYCKYVYSCKESTDGKYQCNYNYNDQSGEVTCTDVDESVIEKEKTGFLPNKNDENYSSHGFFNKNEKMYFYESNFYSEKEIKELIDDKYITTDKDNIKNYICKSDLCYVYTVNSSESFAVIYDKSIFIYDLNKKKIDTVITNVMNGYYETFIVGEDSVAGLVLGLANTYKYTIDENAHYYDLKTKEYIDLSKYDEVSIDYAASKKKYLYLCNYIEDSENTPRLESYLYDTNTKKILKKGMDSGLTDGKIIFFVSSDVNYFGPSTVNSFYTEDFKQFGKEIKDSVRRDQYVIKNGKLLIGYGNKIYSYDKNGNLIKTTAFDDVYTLAYGIVVKKDGYLTVLDNNLNVLNKMAKLTGDMKPCYLVNHSNNTISLFVWDSSAKKELSAEDLKDCNENGRDEDVGYYYSYDFSTNKSWREAALHDGHD